MLQIRNVTKVYQSKTGLSVKALDNVSVSFGETGMVFILGKSGSGKSTLLNVIGGLDGCDAGEFVIKGKSSREFLGSDFDSYRNTFIGFIFQEYNILDDFSVGANIALALELQGKKATSEAISGILSQVELLDYAKRKPNELSGGQKQRVAIARALVKDPQIIMADEPTGALDSNTGKQIFDTLKELSKTKLVIVVSHDRDFAERYGDRIIEMKDGKIESDVTKHTEDAKELSSAILKVSSGILKIKKGYELTKEDLDAINEYLKSQQGDVFVTGDRRVNDSVCSAAGITAEGRASSFSDTEEKDVLLKNYDKTKTKFIRSRLPIKNALKMGANSLGHKKFRLVLTVFLSMIAFALFGFADTLGAYNKYVAATDSIIDSNIKNASLTLGVKRAYVYGDGENSVYYSFAAMNDADVALLKEKTGMSFIPVYTGENPTWGNSSFDFSEVAADKSKLDGAYKGQLSGFTELKDEDVRKLGFHIDGSLPEAEDEIAITELIYRQLNLTGFQNDDTGESVAAGSLTKDANGGKNSIIGKHISVKSHNGSISYKITGVIDTLFDYERYSVFVPTNEPQTEPEAEIGILEMLLAEEMNNAISFGFHALGYLCDGGVASLTEKFPVYTEISMGTQMHIGNYILFDKSGNEVMNVWRVGGNELADDVDVIWLNGKTSLGEKEYLLPYTVFEKLTQEVDITDKVKAALSETLGEDVTLDDKSSLYEILWSHDENKHGTLFRAFTEAFFGRTFSEALPNEFFTNVVQRFWTNSDGKFTVFSNWAYEMLILEYAYLSVYDAGFSDYIDISGQAFFDAIVTRFNSEISYEDEWLTMPELFRMQQAANYYCSYITYNTLSDDSYMGKDQDAVNALGADKKICKDFTEDAHTLLLSLSGLDMQAVAESLTLSYTSWTQESAEGKTLSDYTCAGFYSLGVGGSMLYYEPCIIGQGLYDAYVEDALSAGWGVEVITPHENGIYGFAIAPMPTDRGTVRALVDLNYTEGEDLIFEMQNPVMDTLSNFNEFIEMGAVVFMWIGVGFAVFSALMLMNFISISISYKKREIGILRAVGARSSDVFKIFFSEAAIIALINYVLALIATVAGTAIFNNIVRNEGITVTLLSFGVRQIILMLVISLAVAAVASFLPVYRIARKKPVDAIKDK